MPDLSVENIDEVNIRVRCERSTAKELSDFFTFKVPGHRYMPAYRSRVWDGTIKLYNMFSQEIYKGLGDYVRSFADQRSYSIEFPNKKDNFFTESMVEKYMMNDLNISVGGQKIKPHDHQIKAITHSLKKERCLLLSPTGSGKSLIIYGLLRHYQRGLKDGEKILIIVPTTSLVAQMYSDFKDYSQLNDWDADEHVHQIFSGQDKNTDKQIVVSTWQSLFRMRRDYFSQFKAVIGDECHLFKAKSLTTIMTKLVNARYRVGTTGTLDDAQTHKLVIEGLFGPVNDVTSTKELMEKDILSKLTIDCLLLDYATEDRQFVKNLKYHDEIKWIVSNDRRNRFISKLAGSTKQNTLVLFQFVEQHGKPLYELIKSANPDKKVFLVHGGVDMDDRERIRHICEKEKEAIIVASYGTFSTGINIKNLHNIIFASPSKSKIRILQSIGRQLRKHQDKEVAKLYDIGDDLQWKSRKNHTLKHFVERLKIYKVEQFEFKTIKIQTQGL